VDIFHQIPYIFHSHYPKQLVFHHLKAHTTSNCIPRCRVSVLCGSQCSWRVSGRGRDITIVGGWTIAHVIFYAYNPIQQLYFKFWIRCSPQHTHHPSPQPKNTHDASRSQKGGKQGQWKREKDTDSNENELKCFAFTRRVSAATCVGPLSYVQLQTPWDKIVWASCAVSSRQTAKTYARIRAYQFCISMHVLSHLLRSGCGTLGQDCWGFSHSL